MKDRFCFRPVTKTIYRTLRKDTNFRLLQKLPSYWIFFMLVFIILGSTK